MFKAKVLAIVGKGKLLLEVKLPFDITVTREVRLTGLKIPHTEEYREKILAELKYRQVKVEVLSEGHGKYSVTVYRDFINMNDIMLENEWVEKREIVEDTFNK